MRSNLAQPWIGAWIVIVATTAPHAAEPNYDESAVQPYTLPDALAGSDGRPAATPADWQARCRPHQLALLEATVYGRRLPTATVLPVGDPERADVTLAGGVRATRIRARLRLGDGGSAPVVDVLLDLPRAVRPAPVFLYLNFKGNEAEHAAPALLARGYGVATACYGDVFPDDPGRADGVRAADEPGAIAAWAWGLSRILDWLVRLPEVDATRVIVVGHSRNGKAALWAGACDERFAMVVANESGCGGAALERRNYGETIADITRKFPHWFCPKYATFAGRAADLPTDQHALLALVAPRPLYVASAIDDRWADPRGEFLAAVAAGPAWNLFGLEGLGTAEWPPADTPVGGGRIGYHVRSGGHDLLEYDWLRFADFADRHLPPAGGPARGAGDFRPRQDVLPVPPPADAIVLFGDGSTPPSFTSMAGGPIDWRVEDGALVVNTTNGHANHVVSKARFQDADIHAEFLVDPAAHGNSGLYVHGHYELQIYDSFGVEKPTEQDEGAVYRFGPPLVNAARRPGEWQVYDIRFIAPRRDEAGRIVQAGSVTAWLNGRLVQDGLEFTEPRSPFTPYRHGVTEFLRGVERDLFTTGRGPLFLQDHGSPTRYRNVWIRPLAPAM
ncbi:MAG: DUF1080 domain-containing protein [Planctomycetia bacterium]|nr:DUF1080 domain-containing protein [Planctomycetia bacterium]